MKLRIKKMMDGSFKTLLSPRIDLQFEERRVAVSQKTFSRAMLVLLVISTLALAFKIQPVWADGIIYINADGSITPLTAPISTVDNVTYTFTGNINESIAVQRNSTVIDGAGYTVKGSGTGTGISLESANNVTIRNTSISGFHNGISLNSSSNNTLSNNSITGSDQYGIWLNYSSSNTVSDSNASGNGIGIYLNYSPNNTLLGDNATGNYKGIVLDSSSNNTLHANNAEENPALGIGLNSSSNNTLSDNSATGNAGLGGVGIHLISSSHNTVSGSTATQNYYGIVLDSSPENVLSQNVIDNSFWSNFDVYGSGLSDYINLIDASNLADGKPVYYIVNQNDLAISPATHPSIGYLALVNCTGIQIENLTLANKNKENLVLAYTTDSTITQNNISNKQYGIYLYSSSNNTLSDNTVTPSTKYTDTAIVLDSSSNNMVSDNNVTGNGGGIHVDSSSNNTILGNNITGNSGGIGLGPSSFNDTLSGNTVTGNTSWGIWLMSCSNNTVSSNNVTGNSYDGIILYDALNDIVSGNNVSGNLGNGILINYYCSNETVTDNNISGNTADAISLDHSSSKNTVSGNNVNGNGAGGIALYSTSGNTVSGNNAIGNGDGISLDSSSNNTIDHNNFINNTQQALLSGSEPNAWDDGYPSGGNYWSNYTGFDSHSAPNQNETGSDGIGDTPYVIDANNTDHYPLMAPIIAFDAGTWNGTAYKINILSNSTVSNVQIDVANRTVSFNVTGPESTLGFCRVTIPIIMVQDLWRGNYSVLLNNEQWPFTNWTDTSNTYIYINYTHSEHEVVMVPEFPLTAAVWLFTALSTVAVVLAKRRTLGNSKSDARAQTLRRHRTGDKLGRADGNAGSSRF